MRRAFLAVSLAASIAALPALAVAGLNGLEPAAQPDARVRSVVYSPLAVVTVPVKRGVVTHIVLDEGESIVNQPAMGKGADCARETDTWCVVAAGRDIFIKPKSGATTNNMVLVSTLRRHAFEFTVLPDSSAAKPVMRLSVVVPPPPPRAIVALAPAAPKPLSAEELIENRMQAEPQVRNRNYSVAVGKNSEDIVPVMVFDDGTQTYFSFPNNRPVPTVFQPAPDQSEEMVNARMEGDRLVVDHVARRFLLRLGESVIAIINEEFDPDGVPPANGTTVPGVARVLRAAGPTSQGAVR